jgi:ribosome recycling factor
MAEEGRIAVRHARTEGRDKLKKMDKISEDDVKAAERDLQKAHDDFIGRIDELVKIKEADILEV